MEYPKYLKTRVVVFKNSLDEFYGDTRDIWCVTLEGLENNNDEHVDLAEFKTRKEAREYARVIKAWLFK